MTTPFSLDFAVRAPSPAFVLRAYFDERLTTQIDEAIGLAGRTVLELEDGTTTLHRISRVVMKRRLPAFLQQLVPDGITCREEVTWHRDQDTMTLAVQPLGRAGRARIDTRIEVRQVAGAIRWHHTGEVHVDVRLLGRRIERYLVDEFTSSVREVVATTQAWLDQAAALAPARPSAAALL